ncbi:alpha amylase family protein [Alistipes dispar]|uniref:alpha amylase family protein n=1 Tax=Alistipes dispar TaxID=2585119 RepID=UPI003A92890D
MKKLATVLLLAFAAAGAAGCRSASAPVKPKLMWLDCSANWERFSYPDSIRHYVRKCRETGMTALVLDIKGTSSEVVYPSEYAPRLKEWKGVRRPDFDFIGTFTDAAHASGMEIYGSFNTFAEGNGVFRRGLLYDDRPEWQAVNYLPGRGLVPQLEIPGKKVLFVNPALPEVQEHEIALFKEAARKYDLDGILLDRARYDNIQSDFSDFSREAFERYIGRKLERFPEDIYAWEEDGAGGWKRTDGPWFKKWIEWRASVIHGFFARTREELKAVKPGLKFGAYTGAWYPSYFEVGVNWASREYDPSQEYAWATPEYRNYGYAELLDIYTNGNYYWNVTIDEYRSSNGLHRNETDSEVSKGDHLCVEGGCRYSRRLLHGKPFYGGMYVEDYKRDTTQFKRAVEMNLRESDGLMVFDIVHIIDRDWWGPLQRAVEAYETGEAGR